MENKATTLPAMEMSEAVMQPALDPSKAALQQVLCPMKAASSMRLSNEVSTSLDRSSSTPVTLTQSRAALHQVQFHRCAKRASCRRG